MCECPFSHSENYNNFVLVNLIAKDCPLTAFPCLLMSTGELEHCLLAALWASRDSG